MTHVTVNALTTRIYCTVYLLYFDTLSKQKWLEKLLSEYTSCSNREWITQLCPLSHIFWAQFQQQQGPVGLMSDHSLTYIEMYKSTRTHRAWLYIMLLSYYQHRGQIHGSTTSLRFLCIILRFLRLEVSTCTFGFGFLQNAIHEQAWVFSSQTVSLYGFLKP